MADKKLNKKEIIKEARQLLKQGTSRQATFDILKDKYQYAKDIAGIVKNLPLSKTLKLYRKWNYVLLALLILTTTCFLWTVTVSSFGILLWYGLQIYAVAKILVKYYLYVAIFSAFVLLCCLIAVIFIVASPTKNGTTLIVMFTLLQIPICVLPLWLDKKLYPKPKERKEKYTNSQGQQRMKIIYEFAD